MGLNGVFVFKNVNIVILLLFSLVACRGDHHVMSKGKSSFSTVASVSLGTTVTVNLRDVVLKSTNDDKIEIFGISCEKECPSGVRINEETREVTYRPVGDESGSIKTTFLAYLEKLGNQPSQIEITITFKIDPRSYENPGASLDIEVTDGDILSIKMDPEVAAKSGNIEIECVDGCSHGGNEVVINNQKMEAIWIARRETPGTEPDKFFIRISVYSSEGILITSNLYDVTVLAGN